MVLGSGSWEGAGARRVGTDKGWRKAEVLPVQLPKEEAGSSHQEVSLPAPSCRRYHRVLKKSKRRKALKEFELLQKSDPEAALAKLEELEQLRMEVPLACLSLIPRELAPAEGALPEGSSSSASGADESQAPEQGEMGPLQGHYGQVRPGGELGLGEKGRTAEVGQRKRAHCFWPVLNRLDPFPGPQGHAGAAGQEQGADAEGAGGAARGGARGCA